MLFRKGLTLLRRLCLLVLILASLVLLAISTEMGTRTLYSITKHLVPGELKIGSVQGALTSGLLLENIQYHADDVDIAISIGAIKLNTTALRHLQVQADLIQISGMDIQFNAAHKKSSPPATDTAFTLPVWPHALVIKKLGISHIQLLEQHSRDLSITIASVIWNKADDAGTLLINGISGQVKQHVLEGNVAATLREHDMIVDNMHISLGKAYLDAKGQVSNTLNADWKLHIPSLHVLLPDCEGMINSTGKINGTLLNPVVDANIQAQGFTLADLSIQSININALVTLINKNSAAITLTANDINYNDLVLKKAAIRFITQYTDQTLQTTVKGNFDTNSELTGNITLPAISDLTDANQSIDINLALHAPDIRTLPFVIPNVSKLAGSFNARFIMQGKLMHPAWSLNGDLLHGAATIPFTGMQLKDVHAKANMESDKPLTFGGTVTAGSGQAQVEGKLLLTADNYDLALSAKGQNLEIINTREYQVEGSPDLLMHYKKEGATITGSLFIPKANIAPIDFDRVVSIPDETIFIDQKKSESDFYKYLTLDVSTKFGNAINISYQKLETTLNGDLHLLKSPGSPPTAIGDLYTENGSYTAYGNKLMITSGKLVYAGNLLTNPGIDVKATKKVKAFNANASSQFSNNDDTPAYTGEDTITVGILVRGTVDEPVITFFSDPSGLSQNDIMSYLVFGYPQSQITSASSLALLNSIASTTNLNNKTGAVTDKIEQSLGLSELGFSSTEYFDPTSNTTGSTTAVNIGKKLGKNLSVHYTVGLFYPVSILNLRYQLNRHVMLQTETSTVESGADIIYSIERN